MSLLYLLNQYVLLVSKNEALSVVTHHRVLLFDAVLVICEIGLCSHAFVRHRNMIYATSPDSFSVSIHTL